MTAFEAHPSVSIHETSIVDAGVRIAEETRVWQFVHICQGARIGARCSLGQNVYVGPGVQIGDRVKIQNNVSVYTGVEVEEGAFLGPSCVFTNVINPRSDVERKDEFKATRVGRGATIGANATIVCGNQIGAHAFVGAGAVVTHDVPDHALVVGNPARQIGWMTAEGQRVDAPPSTATPKGTPKESPEDAPIPLLDLAAQNAPLMPQIREAFERVASTQRFIMGPEVEGLERALCERLGVRHAIGVSSGTDALLVALMALGVGQGDEVLTTPFSFFATAGCIARLGARPVFVDIDPVTFNLDPTGVERAITPRTRAILPVHLFGQPCDMASLQQVASRHEIPIVEDAAQALGAHTDGGHVGGLGALGCFSFFPSKNLGAFGDGGLVTSNDDALAARVRKLRLHGSSPKYFHAMIGGNFRLDALQAAILHAKLPHLDRWSAERRANAERYDTLFGALDLPEALLSTPRRVSEGHVYNQYVIRTPHREALRAHLKQAQIGHEVYYPVGLHMQECFAYLGLEAGCLPATEHACREVLALPVFPELGTDRLARIVASVGDFLQQA